MKRTLAEFARACGGQLAGSDAAYTDVVSDSRALQPRQLFVALKGPNFNGNEFVAAALAAGAAGALVDSLQPLALPQIVVADTQAALERAALAWRAAFDGPLVGVAGAPPPHADHTRSARRAGRSLAIRFMGSPDETR